MKLLKPAWISHDGDKPIFSVDIHPDGSRCATGGQGEDSGRVTVWCMAPVVSKEAEVDVSIPKQLCQMDNHLGCVNCVRWSKSGKFLASGGDDKLIMIWQCSRYSAASAVFGGGGKVNVEQWRCVSTLRGHEGDILDLAWSPTDQWLATCSVDNNCIIWNMEKSPEMVTILKGHTGLVKGVSWDPIGKYLASQSDDKSVRIWRTSDWQAEAIVTEPFEECGGTTHVLRLSWSPDGQYLVSAHAMNGGGPTAQIIDREGWKTDKDFVGHRKAITCVNFNSNMLKKKTAEGNKVTNYCCCAIGSRDCSLSIWLTALKRPLVVIHDLFRSSVLDVSWSTSGLQLMACSWDGTVAFIEFTQEELGIPLSIEEKEVLYQKMYGRSYNATVKPSLATSIIENSEYLKMLDDYNKEEASNLREREKFQPDKIMPASMETSTHSSSSIIKGPIDKQIETRTMDGKRRITPMYIPPPPDLGEAPKPFLPTSNQVSTTFSSSTDHKSKIQVEKRDLVTVPGVKAVPTTISTSSTDSHPQPTTQAQALDVRMGEAEESSAKRKTFEKDKPRKLLKPITLEKTAVATFGVGSPSISKTTVTKAPCTLPLPVVEERVGNVLATLPVPKTLSYSIPTVFGGKKAVIDVVNNAHSLGPTYGIHKLTYKQDSKFWEWTVSSLILSVQGSAKVIGVACADATLHVLDHQGSRLFPPFVLSAASCKLFVQQWHMLVVTSDARLSVWDLCKPAALLKSESIRHLLANSGSTLSITHLNLTPDFAPVISFSNGKGFTYNADLGTWMLLAFPEDSVRQMSDMTAMTPETPSQSPLASLQNLSGRGMRTSAVFRAEPELQATCTLAFLDQQIAASRALHSSVEYRQWLLAFVRYAAQQGMEERLRLLCQSLLGPIYSTNGSWEGTVVGHSKHQLLQDSLRIMATNVRLQRLCTEFLDQFNIAKKNSPSPL